MITRILSVGLLAGVLAGLAIATLQHFTTTPLILKAETYENAPSAADKHATAGAFNPAHVILVHGKPHAGEAGAVNEWAPADGWERTMYTSLATIGTAVGFALVLLALMVFATETITLTNGIAWGAAAFVATGLAPAFGIAPELPGSAAADLVFRQIWWVSTAAVTAVGLACLLRAQSALTRLAGVALIALPHIVGAPHPAELTSTVPAELAGHFAAVALGVQAVMWALVGAGVGGFWELAERRAQA